MKIKLNLKLKIRKNKKHIRTNYGPEETDLSHLQESQKREKEKELLKLTLEAQKLQNPSRKIHKNSVKPNDREDILKLLSINNEILKGLREDAVLAKNNNIKMNVKMWDLQSNLKKRSSLGK